MMAEGIGLPHVSASFKKLNQEILNIRPKELLGKGHVLIMMKIRLVIRHRLKIDSNKIFESRRFWIDRRSKRHIYGSWNLS